jgi:hypothetical protein
MSNGPRSNDRNHECPVIRRFKSVLIPIRAPAIFRPPTRLELEETRNWLRANFLEDEMVALPKEEVRIP